jgi:hypothetical protein
MARPLREEDRIIRYRSGQEWKDTYIPYVVEGKEYIYKLLKFEEQENGSTTIENLGYANVKYREDFGSILDNARLVTDTQAEEYDYRHGYFRMLKRREKANPTYGIYYQTIRNNDKNESEVIEGGEDNYVFEKYEKVFTKNEANAKYKSELEESKEENENNLRKAVSNYVMNSNNWYTRQKMLRKMHLWPTLEREIIVFRGQKNPMVQEIFAKPYSFFSTSLDSYTAQLTFTSEKDKCCLFVIHAQPGLKYYLATKDDRSLHQLIEPYNKLRAGEVANNNNNTKNNEGRFEDEVILEGNGTFFQDKEKTKPGFHEMTVDELNALKIDIGERPMTHTKNGKTVRQRTGVFEAYYFPAEKIEQNYFIPNNNATPLPSRGGKRETTRKQKRKSRKVRK